MKGLMPVGSGFPRALDPFRTVSHSRFSETTSIKRAGAFGPRPSPLPDSCQYLLSRSVRLTTTLLNGNLRSMFMGLGARLEGRVLSKRRGYGEDHKNEHGNKDDPQLPHLSSPTFE